MDPCFSVLDALRANASRAPEKTALIAGDLSITYGDLLRNVTAAAATLSQSGVVRGDRVILSASSSPAFVHAYLGCHLLGAAVAPIGPKTPPPRMDFIREAIEPRAVFLSEPVAGSGAESIERFRDLDETTPVDFPSPEPEAIADVLFTTGTTGKPKGVVLTHANLFAAATNINTFIGNTDEDIEVVPIPLSHSFGLGRLRCALLAGGAVVLSEGFLFPAKIFQALSDWKATGLVAVPAGFALLFRLSGDKLGEYAEQLRYVEIGSAPMPQADKERLMRLLPSTRICMHYGLTEASRSAFIEFHESSNELGTIGKASPNVSITIRDQNGEELPTGETGELCVRGGMVMHAYWDAPEETRNAHWGDWLRTGDLAYVNDEGYLHLAGRAKDMINVGGIKVAPKEVEDVLRKHPLVEDVACVGIPDPQGLSGEAVKAFLVAPGTPPPGGPPVQELVELARQHLEAAAVPVAFEWVEEIPKTSSGKVQRRRLLE
jgi:long-chain acyl-CoA synthetase